MNSASAAALNYSSLGEHTRSAKDLEYEVFLNVTRKLTKLSAVVPANFAQLVKALNDNERLWIAIGTQVADPMNELSPSLKAQLFYLAEFVSHHTSKVLLGEAGVSALIETNVAVLRGLKGSN